MHTGSAVLLQTGLRPRRSPEALRQTCTQPELCPHRMAEIQLAAGRWQSLSSCLPVLRHHQAVQHLAQSMQEGKYSCMTSPVAQLSSSGSLLYPGRPHSAVVLAARRRAARAGASVQAQLSRGLKSAASKPVTCQLARAQQLRQGRLGLPVVPHQRLGSRACAA